MDVYETCEYFKLFNPAVLPKKRVYFNIHEFSSTSMYQRLHLAPGYREMLLKLSIYRESLSWPNTTILTRMIK